MKTSKPWRFVLILLSIPFFGLAQDYDILPKGGHVIDAKSCVLSGIPYDRVYDFKLRVTLVQKVLKGVKMDFEIGSGFDSGQAIAMR